MRDIKFRAYIRDKNPRVPSEINKIVEVKSLHLGSKKAIIGYSGGNYSIKFNEIELMQYTGLKDKNGKEIYEGDIVKINVDRACVKWNDKYGYFQLVPIGDYYFDSDVIGQALEYVEAEVIGNIYDNPELLEERE